MRRSSAPSLLAHTRIGDRIGDSPHHSRDFGTSERNPERSADTTQTHAGIHARDLRSTTPTALAAIMRAREALDRLKRTLDDAWRQRWTPVYRRVRSGADL